MGIDLIDLLFLIVEIVLIVFAVLSFKYFLKRKRVPHPPLFWVREKTPQIFEVDGTKIVPCSRFELHNFNRGWCKWCSKNMIELAHDDLSRNTVDLLSQVHGPELSPDYEKTLDNEQVAIQDFNSPTTSTVNLNKVQQVVVNQESLVPGSIDANIVEAYCLKCKTKRMIMNPEYYDNETRGGTRRFVKGVCSICKGNINAITKRGD